MTKKTQTTEEVTLDQFNWDGSDENSFFGVAGAAQEDEVAEVVAEVNDDLDDDELEEQAQVKKKTDKDKKSAKVDENEDEDEDEDEEKVKPTDFKFSDTDEEDDDTKKKGDEVLTPEVFDSIAQYQIQKFKLAKIAEDEEITPERLDELWEEEKEAYADQEFEKVAAQGGDFLKRQLNYVKNGGKPEDFALAYKEVVGIPEFDIETDEGQKESIKFYMKEIADNDDKEITDFFEYLEESGKTEAYAKRYNKKIAEYKAAKDKDIEEKQRRNKELREKEKVTFVNELETVLDDSKGVQGYEIPKNIREQMPEYFAEQTVKLDKGRFVTPFQAKLTEVFQDKEKLAVLGWLMMNDFDLSVFEKKAASKVTRKVKTNLETKRTITPASQSNTRKRSLTDFF